MLLYEPGPKTKEYCDKELKNIRDLSIPKQNQVPLGGNDFLVN